MGLTIFCLHSLLNAQTPGTLKWRYETGLFVESSPAIGVDGTVYVGSQDYYLYAINPDGTLKWRYRTGSSIQTSPAIGVDGTVYVGSSDDYLYAINPDGTLKWRYQTGDIVLSSPAIGSDGTVYVGSRDAYLYAIDPDGMLKWRYQRGRWGDSSPAIGPSGTIYVGDDFLYAINPDGTLKWSYQTGVDFSPAIGTDGTVYVGSWSYLYAINPDGSLKWRYQTESLVYSSPAIGPDGTLYVGSWDDHLYAINPDGSLKWRYQTEDDVRSSPAIGSDGTVYVGSQDDYVYAINPDGTLKWRYQTENWVESSPAVGSDGTIYIGSHDDYLYAIYGDSEGLASSPWPKFRQNNQNTGAFPNVTIFDQVEFTFFSAGETVQKNFTVSNPTTTSVTLNNCVFDHSAFSLSTPLPLTVLPDAETSLTVTIHPDNQGLYQSTCQITYDADGESRSISGYIQVGLFKEDGSESALVAHRALQAYHTCLSENPSSTATKNNRGVLYRLLGEPDLAERGLMGALSQGQGELHGYGGIKMNVGIVKSDQDSSAKAHLFYDAAMMDVASDAGESSLAPQITYNKAWEAYVQNDIDSADIYIDKTLIHDKANDFLKAKAFVLRGAIFYQQGDIESARSDFQQAIVLDPDGPIGRMAQEILDLLTGVEDALDVNIPMSFVLGPNYPNPFNPETTVSFGLPRDCDIELVIYNIRGQRIRALNIGRLKAGWHHVTWNGLDDSGKLVGTGVYLLQMKAGDFESTRKMMFMQ